MSLPSNASSHGKLANPDDAGDGDANRDADAEANELRRPRCSEAPMALLTGAAALTAIAAAAEEAAEAAAPDSHGTLPPPLAWLPSADKVDAAKAGALPVGVGDDDAAAEGATAPDWIAAASDE